MLQRLTQSPTELIQCFIGKIQDRLVFWKEDERICQQTLGDKAGKPGAMRPSSHPSLSQTFFLLQQICPIGTSLLTIVARAAGYFLFEGIARRIGSEDLQVGMDLGSS